MCIDVLTMLQQLRTHRILHRDFKAGNIVITHDNHCILIDFGMAIEYSELYDLTGRFVSTAHIRAPEVNVGLSRYEYEVDVFAAGCVILEIMTSSERLFKDIHSKQFRKVGAQSQFIIDCMYKQLGTATRLMNNQRLLDPVFKPLFERVTLKKRRPRLLENNYYNMIKRRTQDGMMKQLSNSHIIRSCKMVSSLLWWFPFERLVVKAKKTGERS